MRSKADIAERDVPSRAQAATEGRLDRSAWHSGRPRLRAALREMLPYGVVPELIYRNIRSAVVA